MINEQQSINNFQSSGQRRTNKELIVQGCDASKLEQRTDARTIK